MLQVQVAYWTLQENARHNLETERQGMINLNEVQRHNVATEQETQRHNLATEDYYNNLLGENVRHNITSESIDSANAETNRMNAFTNQRNAATNAMNADTNQFNAKTNRFSAVTGYSLGLDANRIAQQNADTNEQNAELRGLEYFESTKQTGVNQKQAEAATSNALTNQINAETRQEELGYDYDNLQFQQDKWRQENVREWVDTGGKFINNISGAISNILKSVSISNGG